MLNIDFIINVLFLLLNVVYAHLIVNICSVLLSSENVRRMCVYANK